METEARLREDYASRTSKAITTPVSVIDRLSRPFKNPQPGGISENQTYLMLTEF
jgi:hypothetical protein